PLSPAAADGQAAAGGTPATSLNHTPSSANPPPASWTTATVSPESAAKRSPRTGTRLIYTAASVASTTVNAKFQRKIVRADDNRPRYSTANQPSALMRGGPVTAISRTVTGNRYRSPAAMLPALMTAGCTDAA